MEKDVIVRSKRDNVRLATTALQYSIDRYNEEHGDIGDIAGHLTKALETMDSDNVSARLRKIHLTKVLYYALDNILKNPDIKPNISSPKEWDLIDGLITAFDELNDYLDKKLYKEIEMKT